jgi:hypothetical protein
VNINLLLINLEADLEALAEEILLTFATMGVIHL